MPHATPRMGAGKLAIRIYLACVAMVVVIGAALGIVANLMIDPALHREMARPARYMVQKLAERRSDPRSLQEEAMQQQQAGSDVALLDENGEVIFASRENTFHALPEDLRRRLDTERSLVFGRPPRVVLAIPETGAVQGYGMVAFRKPPFSPRPIWIVIGIVLLIFAIAAFLFARAIVNPLSKLANAARALGEGDLETRVHLARKDEFGDVGRAFDEMAERVHRLVSSQQELLANVSHEFRSPLARIRVALDLAEEGDPKAKQESLELIAEDLDELESMVGDILTVARLDLGQTAQLNESTVLHLEEISIRDLVQRAILRFQRLYPSHRVETRTADDVPATLNGDPVLLQRVLDNLFDNAGKYSEPESCVTLQAAREQDTLVLTLADNGIGIEQEDLARLFTPFFRTDASRSRATGGVGLGLSLAKKIVTAHGGTISVESATQIGTTIRVVLRCSIKPGDPGSPAK